MQAASPNGAILCKPRVERREEHERRATLGCEGHSNRNPEGVALIEKAPCR